MRDLVKAELVASTSCLLTHPGGMLPASSLLSALHDILHY